MAYPAPLPHLGLVLESSIGSTDFPGPLPHIGGLLPFRRDLIADYGTYTVSGQDATLTSDRTPDPGPLPHLALLGGLGNEGLRGEYGTYSISGQDQGLLYGRSLSADVGYIAIYGQVGLLTRSANTSGEAAPFPSMGTLFAVTISAYTLSCGPGIYSYVGSDGLADFEINGDTTTYALAGQDAQLQAQFRITAESGEYSISGQDAGSSTSGSALTLTADSGTYDISGTDALVLVGARVGAEFGFYALLGQLATLSVGTTGNIDLTAESGTYDITGFDPGLDVVRVEEPVVITGAPGRGVRRERYLAIINGKKHFGTREEIERLIQSLAETQAEKPKKKRAKIVVKPAEPVSTATPEERLEAEEVQADVRQMYEELYRKAVAELERQEEEDLIGLL